MDLIGGGGGSAHSIPLLVGGRRDRWCRICVSDEGTKGEGTEEVCGCSASWLFVHRVMRSATQSIMASMALVGVVGKDVVRSSSHTFTNNITGHFLASIKLSSREYMTVISITRFASPKRLHAL